MFVHIFDQRFIIFTWFGNDRMMHDSPKRVVRCVRLATEDAPALSSLESRCFALPWTEQAFAEAFAGKTFHAFGIRETASPLSPRELAGYIAVYHTPDEVEILNIAVREDRRRHGYGRLLMATALQDAKETGILRGVLEVRISNAPAIHLYESFGFRQAGKRRGDYQDTGEDALIYTLDMGQTRTNP